MGRPLKTEGRRIKKIDARFTEAEYLLVEKLEETLGIRKTDLVRNRLLKDARLTIVNAKEMILALDSIGAEMGRCGNNINQLARYANILRKKGVLAVSVVERYELLLGQYIAHQQALDKLLRQAIRLLGNT